MSYRTSTQRRPNTSAPGDGSRTITITGAPPSEDGDSNDPEDSNAGTLRLRASTRKPRQKVVWRDDVVDNEGCGKKSSKICCIYNKPRRFDESSDEDDSDSDSDSSCGHDHASHRHTHAPNRGSEGLQSRDSGSSDVHHLEDEDSSNNAYEAAPSSNKGKQKAT